MRLLLSIGKSLSFFLFLLLMTFVVGYMLPPPLAYIHVGSVVTTWYIFRYERGRVIWYMFLYSFCIELLVPSSNFGAVLLAGTISALVAYWCHKFFFTNRSIYTGMLLGAIAVLVFRCLWFGYVLVVTILNSGVESVVFDVGIMGYELLYTEMSILALLIIFLKRKHTA